MAVPVSIDVPHQLGKDGARKRLQERLGQLDGHLPGGVGTMKATWHTEDEMALDIHGMGQSIPATLEVHDTFVRVQVSLPPLLAMFSGMIGAAVRDQGTKLLK